MTTAAIRLQAVTELVAGRLSEAQIAQAIGFLLRLAGDAARPAADVEHARAARDLEITRIG